MNNIYEYHKKHKKCCWCRHLTKIYMDTWGITYYYCCEVKDKVLRDYLPNQIRLPRLCKYYDCLVI